MRFIGIVVIGLKARQGTPVETSGILQKRMQGNFAEGIRQTGHGMRGIETRKAGKIED